MLLWIIQQSRPKFIPTAVARAGRFTLLLCALLAGTPGLSAQVAGRQPAQKLTALEHVQTAHALFLQKDYDAAREHYLKALSSYPRNFDMLKNLAYCYYRVGPKGYAQAAKYYSRAYEINPGSRDVAENLAKCLMGSNRAGEAAPILRRMAEQPGAPVTAWKRAAEAYVAAGRMSEAEAAYDAYLQRSPGDLGARSNLGNLYSQEKAYAKALEQYRLVLSSNPNFSPALIGMARVLAGQDQPEESLRLYDRVLRLEPNNGEAASGKAFVFLWTGRAEEAQALFSKLRGRYPRDSEIAGGLAQAEAALRERELAAMRRAEGAGRIESYYRERLAKNPKDLTALKALAEATADPKRCAESIEYSRRVLAISPGDSAPELRMARSLALCGQYPEAIERYRRVLASQPKSEGALYELGATLLRASRGPEAIEVFRSVLQINPQHSDASLGLALTLAANRNYKEALLHYDQVLKTSPDNFGALEGKAYALYWSGQYPQARAIFETLAPKRPGDPQIAEALANIARAEEEARWAALRPRSDAPPQDFLAYYQKRLASYPDDRSAMKGLADVQEQLKNFPAAILAYKQVVEKYPDDRDAKTALARLLTWDDQTVSRARSLVASGKSDRSEGLNLLKERLERVPDDTEARVLYGVVLSWEGNYEEARAQLTKVLATRPDHGDALPALINVELWSDHPERAEQIAREALERKPNDTSLIFAHVHALRNMHRDREAIKALDRLLALDRRNEEAKQMRRRIEFTSGGYYEFKVDHTFDWFSDGRAGQHESSMNFRIPTRAGSISARLNRADRFSLVSYQTEVDFYPSFRPGTYGYVNLGYSADANLYPRYRVGADLFQMLGHGYEGSGGYRRLHFTSDVNIYTFSLAKYYGDWLFTGRGFLTPDELGVSRTGVFSARRFFSSEGLHDYIEFFYSRGASLAQARTTLNIEVLDSDRYGVNIDKIIGNWAIAFRGGVSGQERLIGGSLKRYSIQGSLYYRF